MAVLFFAITVSVPCSAADGEAVYSTKDGTWEQVDDTTWTMDKGGGRAGGYHAGQGRG